MRRSRKVLTFSSNPKPLNVIPKWRSYFVGAAFTAAFLVLALRAMWVQGIDGDFYRQQGRIRQVREFPLHASRGRILDRTGQPLAMSLSTRSLWLDASDPSATPSQPQVEVLGRLLDRPALALEKAVRERKSFSYVKRQVDLKLADQAMALGVTGLYEQKDYRRFYPEGNIAANVVGFSGVDGRGQEGIEKALNGRLEGLDGHRRVLRNAHGQVIQTLRLVAPVPGEDVTLSLDQRVQYAAFKAVREAVQAAHARSGSAIVLDAHSGEILAMANWPTYDPNASASRVGMAMRNRAVTDVFEPGSVIKPITIALALQKGVVSPTTIVTTGGGKLRLDGVTIHDDKNFGTLTVSGVLQKSSNVGTTKIALLLSPKEMWRNFRHVGLGRSPNSGLPGAVAGTVRPYQHWRRIEQATMSYGYGLSVSLLQLAQMYTTFANDGRIVPATIFSRNGLAMRGQQVYSPRVARQVRTMMRSVVSVDGTAPLAAVPGYSVAGKTGTAYQWTKTGYDRRQYRASFVGIIPASRPKVVIAVSIYHPQVGSHFGGAVAGPPFVKIATQTMQMLNVPPDEPNELVPNAEHLPIS
ncbi:peptidoglycan D,D-transpeptidase FtsI family protein [Caballeronia sordidicola]|nr:penicillin-binding protein 2 [Caballeronia sordidicola]